MPIYLYRCPECGRQEEYFALFGNRSTPICCGDVQMEKQPAVPAIAFKGSGWFVNDYGRGPGRR